MCKSALTRENALARPRGGSILSVVRGRLGTVREAAVDVIGRLLEAGVSRGDLVGLAVTPGPAPVLGLATGAGAWAMPSTTGPSTTGPSATGRPAGGLPTGGALGGLAGQLRRIDQELRPRWVVWSGETAVTLTAAAVRLATCWDVAAVHRLLFGGWRGGPGAGRGCLPARGGAPR